jgi:putative endonuclease
MRSPAQRIGAAAESAVERALSQASWTILGRNVHVGRLELDLVCVDPGPPSQLVVVEVRWRSRRDFGLPEETVDHRKRARIREAAFVLLERGRLPDGTPVPGLPLRFDLIVSEPDRPMRHHRHLG